MLSPGSLVRDTDAPELGVGRVLRWDEEVGSADVLFETAAQPRVVRPENASIKRLRLHPGQRVTLIDGSSAVVKEAAERREREVWSYTVTTDAGETQECSEQQLEPRRPTSQDPLENLASLRWRGGWRFFARWNVQDKVGGWHGESEGLPAWLGARCSPTAWSVWAARQALFARAPRALFAAPSADQARVAVGLVLLELFQRNPAANLLIVTPGTLARGWVERLYVDFGGRVTTQLDLGRWETSDEMERDEVLGSPRLVVTPALVARREEVRAYIEGTEWDLVVVDEAVNLTATGKDDVLAPWLARVAEKAAGVLALSTSARCDDLALLGGLLDVVQPGVSSGLKKRAKALQSAQTGARALAAGEPDQAADALASSKDPLVAELRGDAGQADELLDHLRRHYRLDPRYTGSAASEAIELESLNVTLEVGELALWDHMSELPCKDPLQARWQAEVFSALRGLPSDLVDLLDLRARALNRSGSTTPDWLADAVRSAPSPGEAPIVVEALANGAPAAKGEAAWLDTARDLAAGWEREGSARLLAALGLIESHLAGGGGKVVAVTPSGALGGSLSGDVAASCFSDKLGPEAVAHCHAEQDQVERSEALRRYRETEECTVLVVDEAGAHGLAPSLLILFGPTLHEGLVPSACVDLARASDQVVSLVGEHPLEQACNEGWEALRQARGGVLAARHALVERTSAACGGADALRAFDQQLLERVGSPDPWGDLHAPPQADLEEATELAEVLEEASIEGDAPELKAWGRSLRVKLRTQTKREWQVSWRPDNLARPLPGIAAPAVGVERVRFRGTFDPLHARENPSLALLAPGHPLIEALVGDAHGTESDGRLTVIRRDLGDWPGKIALVVLFKSSLGPAGDELPEGMLRRARRRLWPEPVAEVVSLHPGTKTLAKPVTDRARRRLALAPFVGKDVEPKIDPDVLCDALPLPALLAIVNAGVECAMAQAKAERLPLCEDAAKQLSADIKSDQAFLSGLAAAGDKEAKAALARHEALLQAVREERYVVDSIAVIIG